MITSFILYPFLPPVKSLCTTVQYHSGTEEQTFWHHNPPGYFNFHKFWKSSMPSTFRSLTARA